MYEDPTWVDLLIMGCVALGAVIAGLIVSLIVQVIFMASKVFDTPTYNINISGADFTGCDVYVTFMQGRSRKVMFGPDDFDYVTVDAENQTVKVGCTFSQEQSSVFKSDMNIEFQVTIVDPNDYRVTSDIHTAQFGRQLRQEVIRNA